jgi:hypothetical protein
MLLMAKRNRGVQISMFLQLSRLYAKSAKAKALPY